MVPAAATTHFDDVYVYVAIARGEHRQFGLTSCLPRGGTKLITENIVHQPQVFAPTDGTTSSCGLSVKPAGVDQVWRGVTNLVLTHSAGRDVAQQRLPLKRVIHVRRYRLHVARVLAVARAPRIRARFARLWWLIGFTGHQVSQPVEPCRDETCQLLNQDIMRISGTDFAVMDDYRVYPTGANETGRHALDPSAWCSPARPAPATGGFPRFLPPRYPRLSRALSFDVSVRYIEP